MSRPIASISVLQRVGSSPGFRDSAAVLFAEVAEGAAEVVLNFDGVSFISRGFADELHQLRQQFQHEHHIPVRIENAAPEVMEMLEVVVRTQHATPQQDRTPTVRRVSDARGLEDLLLGS